MTEKYVIFKGCHDKTEIKHYFEFEDDIDEQIMHYLLHKHRTSHFRIDMDLSVQVVNPPFMKRSLVEKKRIVQEFVEAFGRAHMSDISECYPDMHPLEVGNIFRILEKEGKGKIDDEKDSNF